MELFLASMAAGWRGDMSKVRLLLVNNPLSSLFMASWSSQNKCREQAEWTTVAVYGDIDYDETYSQDIELKKKIHLQACRRSLDGFFDQWVLCLPKRYDTGCVVLWDMAAVWRKRCQRRQELGHIKKTLAGAGVSLADVKEIWHGNGVYDPHFFYLCPHAKGTQFEHGLSEIRNAMFSGIVLGWQAFLRDILRSLYHRLQRHLVFWSPSTAKDEEYVSLLAQEILQANPRCKLINKLRAQEVLAVSKSVMAKDLGQSAWDGLKGPTAVVMFFTVKTWAKAPEDHLEFFDRFEGHISEVFGPVFARYGVKNIIFKSRFFNEEYCQEGFNRFSRLNKEYDLFYLSAHSPANYPVEYYVPQLQPVVLVGPYSGGLFYSKKLFPAVATFSYHQWYIDYCRQKYGLDEVYEFEWLTEFFGKTYKEAFGPVHPS